MKLFKIGALGAMMALQGCSTMMGAPDFVPADPEGMSEWQVEGSVKVDGKNGKQKAFIAYKQINGEYELQVRQDKPVGEPGADQVQHGFHARASPAKQRNGITETVDRPAPLLPQQQR